jgi:hypothetical protein
MTIPAKTIVTVTPRAGLVPVYPTSLLPRSRSETSQPIETQKSEAGAALASVSLSVAQADTAPMSAAQEGAAPAVVRSIVAPAVAQALELEERFCAAQKAWDRRDAWASLSAGPELEHDSPDLDGNTRGSNSPFAPNPSTLDKVSLIL